jgi:hypothetical protein
MRFIAALLALIAFAAPLAAQPAEPPVVAEARAFMASYAADLSAGRRVDIVRRYDRNGAFFLGNGARRFERFSDIMRDYANQWSPPWRFAWRDLAFEPAGADAVVVAGQFLWTVRDGAEPMVFSYTAFLHRQDGVLRIRLEDESTDSRRTPAG